MTARTPGLDRSYVEFLDYKGNESGNMSKSNEEVAAYNIGIKLDPARGNLGTTRM